MKIAFDNQVFDLQRYGGISRYFCELASKLATLPGNDVSIVAPLYVNEYLRSICPSVHTTGRYLGHVKKSHRQPVVQSTGKAMGLLDMPQIPARGVDRRAN